ncbi:MAG TPA: 50S ribosomal protein L24 [Deltaproteobacteria bacterium]|nr:50S ribosomal protein L24 [Deltaproteobacteria bacterium]HCP47702.1 50S ribosomal protein L24 [Deltaproteobacteria bacterium]|tara:strand:+ start:1606 stop:1941 length:336 start_codon:yes stop_codon:yes gene_type:complete
MATRDKNKRIRLRIGDTVQVTSGAHKGETGQIKRFKKDLSRAFVEGVNKVKRHEKPMPALGRMGGIVEKEASIHISNLSLLTADGQQTRVGYKVLENGQKVRVARKTGEEL